MHARRPSALLAGLLALAALAALGARCGPVRNLKILSPTDGALLVEGTALEVSGRVGPNFDPATAGFELDGVDLAQALGLAPPFADEGGVVTIGSDAVTVSGFTYDPNESKAPSFSLAVAGLAAGDHVFELSAERKDDAQLGSELREIAVVGGFAQALPATTSAGLPRGPVPTGEAGFLGNQALGRALAAPPRVIAGGGTLRSGHVEAVERRIAIGGP